MTIASTNLQKEKIALAWSGGKDSSYALYQLQQSEQYEVAYLLSTINGNFKRLSMHGVKEELIEAQAAAIGLPLIKVYVYEADNQSYEKAMNEALLLLKARGINTIAFGDIFLEDLRSYREEKMASIGMSCLFPLWKKDTHQLVQDFLSSGFETMICCINDGYLNESWVGRTIDHQFIEDLPENVDPCGENGEFHSFCFKGPIFSQLIPIESKEKTYKALELRANDHPTPIPDIGTKGFWFIEIEKKK
ncbi:MAG: diphthine--ammonia ligase [Chitinophagaceae bacterium]|uniref:Dph6-related ATP pyrophosphatase n=1 Tax=unclassified Paraflavitalea TaxID=2798305 RepID=UPI003D34219E|nr:diphthine--ammonia ligase [Chitinophagaceae bacterium]